MDTPEGKKVTLIGQHFKKVTNCVKEITMIG